MTMTNEERNAIKALKDEKREKLITALNGNGTDGETGEVIFSGFDSIYNVFGSYKEISESVKDELSEEGERRFWVAWAICGMELAFHYIFCCFDEWDDRKKKSEEWAYKNISYIEEVFEKNCGKKVSFNELSSTEIRTNNYSFPTWFTRQIYYNDECWDFVRENRWLEKLAQKFVNMHSTLKQSFFGGIVRMINEEERFPLF